MAAMKVNRIHRTRKKARVLAGLILALAVTTCEIHAIFEQGRHHPYAQECSENATPLPRQDVYLPPW
jgi:hypothetical protein